MLGEDGLEGFGLQECLFWLAEGFGSVDDDGAAVLGFPVASFVVLLAEGNQGRPGLVDADGFHGVSPRVV